MGIKHICIMKGSVRTCKGECQDLYNEGGVPEEYQDLYWRTHSKCYESCIQHGHTYIVATCFCTCTMSMSCECGSARYYCEVSVTMCTRSVLGV